MTMSQLSQKLVYVVHKLRLTAHAIYAHLTHSRGKLPSRVDAIWVTRLPLRGVPSKEKDMATKFENLILYVCKKSNDDPRFGKVKLNKLLYFIDFGYFLHTGKSIGGVDYVKLERGPAPKNMPKILKEMKDNHLIEEHEIAIDPKRTLHKHKACAEPNLEGFSPMEVAYIDDVIGSFKGLNGNQMSVLSHQEPGYIVTQHLNVIPFMTAYMQPIVNVTATDKKATVKLAKKLGWHDTYAA